MLDFKREGESLQRSVRKELDWLYRIVRTEMSDDFEEVDGVLEVPHDPIAERTAEYRKLVETTDKLKSSELRKESLLMLKRLRLSFGAHSEVNLTSLPGGKA